MHVIQDCHLLSNRFRTHDLDHIVVNHLDDDWPGRDVRRSACGESSLTHDSSPFRCVCVEELQVVPRNILRVTSAWICSSDQSGRVPRMPQAISSFIVRWAAPTMAIFSVVVFERSISTMSRSMNSTMKGSGSGIEWFAVSLIGHPCSTSWIGCVHAWHTPGVDSTRHAWRAYTHCEKREHPTILLDTMVATHSCIVTFRQRVSDWKCVPARWRGAATNHSGPCEVDSVTITQRRDRRGSHGVARSVPGCRWLCRSSGGRGLISEWHRRVRWP